jgi:hypothetical protein
VIPAPASGLTALSANVEVRAATSPALMARVIGPKGSTLLRWCCQPYRASSGVGPRLTASGMIAGNATLDL